MTQKTIPATAAEAGIVRIHAQTIRLATPQRTAESLCTAPTPTIAPVMVWVVLTGIPASAVPKRVMAPALSAQNPPKGFSLVILDPIRSEEHTSELQSQSNLVCRLLLEKKHHWRIIRRRTLRHVRQG